MTEKINFGKRAIDTLPIPDTNRVRYRDAGSRYLYLDVFPSGLKTFLYVRKIHGKVKFLKIGCYPEITPFLARQEADKKSQEVALGKELGKIRDRSNNTFADLFNVYLEKHLKLNTRLWKESERVFKVYLKPLYNKNLTMIYPDDIRGLHAKLTHERGEFMANRAIRLVRSAYNFAIFEGQFIPNPASRIKMNKEPSRKRYIEETEIGRFFKALDTLTPEWQDFFKIALFTGARKSNVQAMRWNDLDFERKMWIVPAKESKNQEKMEIVLSELAIKILKKRKRMNKAEFVFPSHGKTKHLVEPKGAWKRLLKEARLKDLRIHDLRRTFGTYQVNEGSSLPIIGKSLGHAGTASTVVYTQIANKPVRESIDKAVSEMFKAGKENKK